MKNQKALFHGISVVDAHYVQEGIACIYILQQQHKICIIETGTAYTVPYIVAAIEELGLPLKDVEYVIPTHIHLDHAGGAGELMQQCPNARLIIHPRGAAHMINPEKLESGTIAVYGEEKFKKLYGSLTPIDEDRIIIAEDNFNLDFHGRALTFLHTPGHALHHFCIYDELSKGIFTGDTFGLAYKFLKTNTSDFIFATTTPVHFDPDAMLNSIDRLMTLNPEVMYLTHFAEIKPTQSIVNQLKKSIHAFVDIAIKHKKDKDHREQAIQQELLKWLVSELRLTNSTLENKKAEKLLRGDSILNAQGLNVWLKRLEKLGQDS